ncbi:MAG TPA: DUF4286 family protein [Chitinophagaceae bacterium]|nr:DUF4286 family protein [Chitinophagaceae bacterium]
MLVYNITMKVDPTIINEWVRWQKDEHIPEIMATGLFDSYKFFHLLEQDETDGVTYIIQYFTLSKEKYNIYLLEFAPQLREKATKKWGNRFVAFRTVMELVQ